jgi:flavin-binding protein dodecin
MSSAWLTRAAPGEPASPEPDGVLDAADAKCEARICRRSVEPDVPTMMASRKRSGRGGRRPSRQSAKESAMSVYRVTEIIGTSGTSWEDAAAEAIKTAAGTLRDLRVAEVVKQDIHLDEDGAITYRTKLQLSFKYEGER